MKSRDDVLKKVVELLAYQFGALDDSMDEETVVKSMFNVDSLDCVEIVMEIEDEFDIRIEDSVASTWTTVKSIVDTVMGILESKK